jgi:orotate phosphoribosyltransferase
VSDIEQTFVDAGAKLEGHFLLASGLHSATYWEKFRVLQFPEHTVPLCTMIADRFRDERIDVVAGPTTGGVILAFEVARQLGVRAVYAERGNEGGRVFRRGQTLTAGERILIVDDVLTAGGSIRDVIDAIKALSGDLVGIGVLVDRSTREHGFGAPLYGCLKTVVQTHSPEECPQCAAGVPLTKPGGGN